MIAPSKNFQIFALILAWIVVCVALDWFMWYILGLKIYGTFLSRVSYYVVDKVTAFGFILSIIWILRRR